MPRLVGILGAGPEDRDWIQGERRQAMNGIPTIYCPRCHTLRALMSWRDLGEALAIQLDPCGHVIERDARLEWPIHKAAA